jgi:hypothetical protein
MIVDHLASPAVAGFSVSKIWGQGPTAWARDPRPQPDTTEPDTDTDTDPRVGPAPESPADRDRGLDHERHLQPA